MCVCVWKRVCEGECGEHSNNQSGALIRFGSPRSLLNLSSIRCNREPSCMFMKQAGTKAGTRAHRRKRQRDDFGWQ